MSELSGNYISGQLLIMISRLPKGDRDDVIGTITHEEGVLWETDTLSVPAHWSNERVAEECIQWAWLDSEGNEGNDEIYNLAESYDTVSEIRFRVVEKE